MTAQELLTEMAASYASLRTYRDTGRVISKHPGDPDSDATTIPFATWFERPRRLRIEFEDSGVKRIVWRDGGATSIYHHDGA